MLRSRSLGPRTLRANATFRSRAATGNSRGRTKRGSPGSRRGRGSTGSRQLADSGKLRARRALREASPLKPRVGGIFVTGVCRWVRRVDPCGNKTSTNRRRANRIRFSRQRRVKKRGGGAIRLITVKRPARPAGGPDPATVHGGGKREQKPRPNRGNRDSVEARQTLQVHALRASNSRSRNLLDVHGLSPAFMRSGGIEKVARDWRKTSQEGKIT